MGYKDDMCIDKFSLDAELVRQPSLYTKWAQAEVDAQDDRDRAKDQLDIIKAQLDQEIRSNAKPGERTTEAAIANAIVLDPRYRRQMDVYLGKIKEAKTLQVARESLEHKRRSLGKLVDLYISGYWAESQTVAAKAERATEAKSTEAIRAALDEDAGRRVRGAKANAGDPAAKSRRKLDK